MTKASKAVTTTMECRYGTMTLFGNDTIVSRSLIEYGEWAQAELDLLGLIAQPGDTVLDVGAFIGTHTLAFAQMVGKEGTVIAIEPQPPFFELLKTNVSANHLQNVRVLNLAVSDTETELAICLPDLMNVTNYGGLAIMEASPTRHYSQHVPAVTIDALDMAACSLIKIDAERMEMQVLRGAKQTLNSMRPVVFAECQSLDDGWPVVDLTCSHGYSAFLLSTVAFNPQNFRKNQTNFLEDGRETSLLFLPIERLMEIQIRLGGAASLLIPIHTVDDLALGLLSKPQYKHDVMQTSAAAKVLGADFWANEPELNKLREGARVIEMRMQQAESDLQSARAELQRLLEERSGQSELVTTLSADLQNASIERTKLLSAQQNMVATFTDTIERIVEEKNRLRANYDQSTSELSSTIKENADLKAAKDAVESEASDLRKKHAELSTSMSHRLDEAVNLKAELDQWVQRQADISSSHERTVHLLSIRLEESAAERALRESKYERSAAEHEAEKALLRSKYESSAAEHEAEKALLRSKYESSAAECEKLAEESRTVAARLDTATTELHSTLGKLNSILGSRGWKTLSVYYKCRNALLSSQQSGGASTSSDGHSSQGSHPLRLLLDHYWIKRSRLFNAAWYLSQYPDVQGKGVDPLKHYLQFGAAEGRDPSPYFDTDWYLSSNPDVARAGINPLRHYLRRGGVEQRDPSPKFDTKRYLQIHPEVAAAKLNPLDHFLTASDSGAEPLDFDLDSAPEHRSAYLSDSGIANTHLTANNDNSAAALAGDTTTVEVESSVDLWAVLNNSGPSTEREDSSYESMVAHLQSVHRHRIERLVLPQPETISLGDHEFAQCADALEFPKAKLPLVSIVIPVYNHLRYTLECLASISRYSAGIEYEVVVIDDGSSDATLAVLTRIANLVYFRNDQNLGFIRSCNRGAQEARGKYVLFLNNDAQATRGWLLPLLETFDRYDNVGAVGPKVLYLNGRLQEAGAVVNPDGTSKLVGLFDDPSLPQYNRTREVPYCSGVCLILERKIFLDSGGFNEELVPAYCEDCDLAFRLRSIGLRVLYNPESTILHHLSVTTGSAAKKTAVMGNQQKLAEKWQQEIDELNQVKLIAFYLPQFHPIPENDEWWGKGFSEWTNVTKARPNYIGQYQPHLPADLGFYDLRLDEVREHQGHLARRYGLYGFCYYYYWFAGKRLLEKPLERMLETTKPDLPFCLAWANENWTRRWDGREKEVLIAQEHSDEDDRAVMRDMMRYMRHRNYIRVNGKLVVIIYRVNLFPSILRTTEIWRELCHREGVGEIYLVMAESFEYVQSSVNPASLGFDASVEFPPHGMSADIPPPGRVINPNFRGMIHDYREIVTEYLKLPVPAHVRFRSAMPGWDNTARRQDDPVLFEHTAPGAYQAWLEAIIENTRQYNFGDERLVFINAWNEWAEGNHLEPDKRNGHAFLEATLKAKQGWLRRQAIEW